MSNTKIRYSVMVPAFCEEKIIESSLKKLHDELIKNPDIFSQTEVIVVAADGGDKTAMIVQEQAGLFNSFKLVEPGKKVGKGRDVRAGMLAASGDYVLFLDADMATPPHHIYPAFDKVQHSNCDILIANRPLTKIHNTFKRKFLSVASNMMIRVLAVPGIDDTQCGFKVFRKEVIKPLFEPLETLSWGFDIEILVRARAKKYKIDKIKINDWFDPKEDVMGLVGESNLHAYLNTLKELLVISYKRFTGYYK